MEPPKCENPECNNDCKPKSMGAWTTFCGRACADKMNKMRHWVLSQEKKAKKPR